MIGVVGVEKSPLSAAVCAGAAANFGAVRDELTVGTWSFIGEQVEGLDANSQRAISREYRKAVERCRRDKIAGMWRGSVEQEANERLREFRQHYKIHDLCLTSSDGEIVAFCDARVSECKGILSGHDCDGAKLRALSRVADRYTLAWFAPFSELELGPCDAWPLFNRMTCKRWWRRQVRKLQARQVEVVARLREKVGRKRDLYVSDWNVSRAKKAAYRNKKMLQQVEAVNDAGDAFTLAELQAAGVSDQGIRRKELMTRMRGFNDVAHLYGHAGEFWTLTTPSRFHAMTVVGGGKKKGAGFAVRNENWDGSTPMDGQQWLCLQWSRIRAALDRKGIRCYGFRIAEPHHDGTPHWHMALFFEPEQVSMARKIARHYLWRMDSPSEKKAWRHRFDAKAIDEKKGSATGYLAKYISKNINGAYMSGEASDEDEASLIGAAVTRVRAWAGTWGIRQFQQIGGPSVTVWRELRRLEGSDSQLDMFSSPWIQEAAEAADGGDWFGFVIAMGGPNLPRDCRAIKPAYWIAARRVESEEGDKFIAGRGVTAYGDDAPGAVFGLWCLGAAVLTRFYQWTLNLLKDDRKLPEIAPPEGFNILARAAPWSSVNNCTV